MPTRFPERRPRPGFNSLHAAGISLCFAAVILLFVFAASHRASAPHATPSPAITDRIAPS